VYKGVEDVERFISLRVIMYKEDLPLTLTRPQHKTPIQIQQITDLQKKQKKQKNKQTTTNKMMEGCVLPSLLGEQFLFRRPTNVIL